MGGQGEKIYKGQVIGIHQRFGDLVVNAAKAKKATNVRSNAEIKVPLASPKALSRRLHRVHRVRRTRGGDPQERQDAQGRASEYAGRQEGRHALTSRRDRERKAGRSSLTHLALLHSSTSLHS